jgi:hypothetical protein
MTPAQLKRNATQDDIIMLAAYFEIQAEDMDPGNAPGAPAPAPARRRRRR